MTSRIQRNIWQYSIKIEIFANIWQLKLNIKKKYCAERFFLAILWFQKFGEIF